MYIDKLTHWGYNNYNFKGGNMKEHFSFDELVNSYNRYLRRGHENSLDSFAKFLRSNGYDDTHAPEVYESILTGQPIAFNQSFELEKSGNRYAKRLIVTGSVFVGSFLAALGLTAIATTIGGVAGTNIAGIEIMGNFFKTAINQLLVSLGIATVTTTAYDLSKTGMKKHHLRPFNYMNKAFFLKYGNDKSMLKQFEKSLRFDDDLLFSNSENLKFLNFDKLLDDTKHYCEETLTKNRKNFLQKAFP